MTPRDEHDTSRASIREVMVLIEGIRKEMEVEVDKLAARVDARFDTHVIEHRREHDRRTGYIRWAVTSILTGLGVVVALYVAIRGG